MRLAFLTSTPLDFARGSGTFSGIATLANALKNLGAEIDVISPRVHFPNYTIERLWFNERLRTREFQGYDAVVGFDMDGYRMPVIGPPHIASIKGVIADEMRFERGMTRATMAIQAACERKHVQRAGTVITTSQYAAARLQELYGLALAPRIVPELIDLAAWRDLFKKNADARPQKEGRDRQGGPPHSAGNSFTVLAVCRFYPRKRLEVLLRAAALLGERIPELAVRIVGNGPEAARLHRLTHELRLESVVSWLGDLTQLELAGEYNQCDIFCLPSIQEGFGIVFLEAMAAGKPIVAARAAAVPEVVTEGLLVEPESVAALAEALERLHSDVSMRLARGEAGRKRVEQFDAPVVARRFLDEIAAVKPSR